MTNTRRSFTYRGPLPPSANHAWGRRGKRTFLGARAREFRKLVAEQFVQSRCPPLMGPLRFDLKLCPPNRRRRDLDNYFKQPLDALQEAGAFPDDRYVVALTAQKCECRTCVPLECTVSSCDPGDFELHTIGLGDPLQP